MIHRLIGILLCIFSLFWNTRAAISLDMDHLLLNQASLGEERRERLQGYLKEVDDFFPGIRAKIEKVLTDVQAKKLLKQVYDEIRTSNILEVMGDLKALQNTRHAFIKRKAVQSFFNVVKCKINLSNEDKILLQKWQHLKELSKERLEKSQSNIDLNRQNVSDLLMNPKYAEVVAPVTKIFPSPTIENLEEAYTQLYINLVYLAYPEFKFSSLTDKNIDKLEALIMIRELGKEFFEKSVLENKNIIKLATKDKSEESSNLIEKHRNFIDDFTWKAQLIFAPKHIYHTANKNVKDIFKQLPTLSDWKTDNKELKDTLEYLSFVPMYRFWKMTSSKEIKEKSMQNQQIKKVKEKFGLMQYKIPITLQEKTLYKDYKRLLNLHFELWNKTEDLAEKLHQENLAIENSPKYQGLADIRLEPYEILAPQVLLAAVPPTEADIKGSEAFLRFINIFFYFAGALIDELGKDTDAQKCEEIPEKQIP